MIMEVGTYLTNFNKNIKGKKKKNPNLWIPNWYLMLKLLLWSAYSIITVIGLYASTLDDGMFHFVWFTNWNHYIGLVYMSIVTYQALQYYKLNNTQYRRLLKSDSLLHWSKVFFSIALCGMGISSVIYWALLVEQFSAVKGPLSRKISRITTHGVNLSIILIDYYLSNLQVNFRYFAYPIIFSIIYIIFSLFHYIFGFTNPVDGQRYIYAVWNWENPSIIGLIFVGNFVMCSIVFAAVMYSKKFVLNCFGFFNKLS